MVINFYSQKLNLNIIGNADQPLENKAKFGNAMLGKAKLDLAG